MATLESLGLNKELYRIETTDNGDSVIPASSLRFLQGIGGFETSSESLTSGEIAGDLILLGGLLQSKNFVSGSSGWKLTPTSGELNFALSVDSLDIPDTVTANSFHVDNVGNLWIGSTTFVTAPFKVDNAGNLTATSVSITGGTVEWSTVTGTINAPEDNATVGATAGTNLKSSVAVVQEDEDVIKLIQSIYGDGTDGSVTISSNVNLTADVYYENLTINSGFTLNTNGYRVFVKGIATIIGTISNNGGNGGNAGSGADGFVGAGSSNPGLGGSAGGVAGSGFFEAGEPGTVGTQGGSGGGALSDGNNSPSGTNGGNIIFSLGKDGKDGVQGGRGGDGNGGVRAGANGGAGGSGGTAVAASLVPRTHIELALMRDFETLNPTKFTTNAGSAGSSGGGGGGGGNGSNVTGGDGGGAGGSGGSGGIVLLAARTLIVNASGKVLANGGDGGNGGNGGNGTSAAGADPSGGGGGGATGSGGNGGIIVLIYNKLTNNGTIQAAGGAAGPTPGSGGGAGGGGTAQPGNAGTVGFAGESGTIFQLKI